MKYSEASAPSGAESGTDPVRSAIASTMPNVISSANAPTMTSATAGSRRPPPSTNRTAMVSISSDPIGSSTTTRTGNTSSRTDGAMNSTHSTRYTASAVITASSTSAGPRRGSVQDSSTRPITMRSWPRLLSAAGS
jgi:hypothetical protein